MNSEFKPADEPYDIGDIVHIHAPEPEYEHRFGCEVVEVHCDGKPTATLEDHSYTLYAYGVERELGSKYPHRHLIPSPRGYPNINDLLGETPINGEEIFGKFKRPDLQLMNKYLTLVDVESDPTLIEPMGDSEPPWIVETSSHSSPIVLIPKKTGFRH